MNERPPLLKEEFSRFLQGKSQRELEEQMQKAISLMTYYRCATLEIETKFRVLNEQFSLGRERNPIENIQTRVKSMDSILEKLKRKGFPVTLDSVEQNLNDVAGVRVICGFLDDIYLLADCLLQQDDVRLIERKDYIEHPKANGYRSLHLIVEIPIFLANAKKYIKVEVQLRTIAMETWAKLEHRMRYKKNLNEALLSETSDALHECARMSNELDRKMQQIRDIIEG